MNYSLLRPCVIAMVLLAVASRLAAAPLDSPVKAADIDFAACRAWIDGQPAAGDAQAGVLGALGLPGGQSWSVGSRDQGEERQYLVVFTRPVAVGSVLFQHGGTLRYLKPGAALPADAANTSLWQTVAFPPAQSGWRLGTLPPGAQTQAFLCTLHRAWGDWHRLATLRLFLPRFYNAVPDAIANAEADYIQYHQLGPPTRYFASNVIRGSGAWQSHGPDKDERINRAPVSDVAPTWFVVSWDQPRPFSAVVFRGNFRAYKLLAWQGADKINPAVGGDADWAKVKAEIRRDGDTQWLTFPPLTTRGLKFLVEDAGGERFGRLDALQALVDLADAPVPARAAAAAEPPFRITVELPRPSTLSMAVDASDGRRVRNLVFREDRPAGPQAVPWDLKDEDGQVVAPGPYRWKALHHPGLTLRYEMTPYPNVEMNAPGNSPWLNGQSGPGGWMADHTPPRAVCAAGERLFLSDPCCESGVALIECDLDGRKSWGHGNIIAWTGPSYMAADEKALYTAPSVGDRDYIWRFALADKKMDTFLQLDATATRRRGIRGLAARDGKLYLAINAGANALENAASAQDVDILNCEPRYPEQKRSNRYDEPNPRNDFLRLLRLTGTPPGNSGGLTWLETAREPAPRQHIVVAFRKPVPLGSFVFPLPEEKDLTLHLSVLKPDAPYPRVAGREADWTRLWKGVGRGWTVVPAPSNTVTRAVRLSFDKGLDELDEVMAEEGGEGLDVLTRTTDGSGDKDAWNAQLEGMKLLRRRFANLFPGCKVTVSSGAVNAQGVWDAQRTAPLTKDDPAVYMMAWPGEQSIRGLAIKEIDGRFTEVDAWAGAGEPQWNASEGWEPVARYEQKLRYYYSPDENHNSRARYMDGYVDFGRDVTTRALRLRVVEQWMWKEEDRAGCVGVRNDRGGDALEPTRCRVYGVAPLQYLGGEPETDPLATERIEVYSTADGKRLQELPFPAGGDLAFNRQGVLYGITQGKVAALDLANGRQAPLALEVKKPGAIAFDSHGNLYVFDTAREERVVKVFDPAGKPLRTIGTRGGRIAGPWDPTRFGSHPGVAVDLEVDSRDQLWVVECDYAPKRVSRWAADGTFQKDFFGNTPYGGGGCLDPYDKSRLFYQGFEFGLDWATGATRLQNVTWLGDSPGGEVPIKVGDRLYLVTRPLFLDQHVGVVYLYDKGLARRVAAVGSAGNFDPLRTSAVLRKLGQRALGYFQFAWSDRNGDGQPQADEVDFFDTGRTRGDAVGRFDDTLSVDSREFRFQVKEILSNGAPVYERQPKAFRDLSVRTFDGDFFLVGNEEHMARVDGKGKTLWSHPAEGWGTHALNRARPWYSGQVVAQFGVVGHETTHAGDLGEFFVTHGNSGVWHIWSADGLLAGRLFRDMRGPGARPWSMAEHQRGLDLSDVTVGQEHFNGYFCRTVQDNRYYAVAGHNHASVVEVVGMDGFKRAGGEVTVTQEQVRQALDWDRQKQARRLYERARLIECRRVRGAVTVDGSPGEWESANAEIEDRGVSFCIAYDDVNLYVCYTVQRCGPLRNAGNDWKRLFKTGAAVDLQLGADPAAPADRSSPVAGDSRLLMTVAGGKPVAVLYQPAAPGAKPDEAWETHTMVFRANFDRVVQVPEVRMAAALLDDGYCLEAAIPLKTLGLTIKPDLMLKMDWGILVSGPQGTEVMQRLYWANPQTAIVSDEAAEAMLHPDLWGIVRFAAGAGRKGQPELNMERTLAPGGDEEEIELED